MTATLEAPVTTTTSVELTLDQIRSVASMAAFASKDLVTPILLTVELVAEDDKLTVFATDRYIAGELTLTLNEPNQHFRHAIPTEALTKFVLATKANKTGGAPVTITVDDEARTVTIAHYDNTSTTPMIYGNYPPIGRLFPDETTKFDGVPNFAVLPSKIAKLDKFVFPNEKKQREGYPWRMYFQGDDRKPILATRESGYGTVRVLIQPNLMR